MILKKTISIILLSALLVTSITSCVTLELHENKGKHKGWYKNPHHSHSSHKSKEKHGKSKPGKKKHGHN